MTCRLVRSAFVLLASLTIASLAGAGVVDMGASWPNADGLSWTYSQRTENLGPTPTTTDRVLRMLFEGVSVAPTAIDVQVLRGELLSGALATRSEPEALRDPFLRSLLRARPDLRPRIEAAAALGVCPTDHPVGFDAVLLSGGFAYRKTASEISAWRCALADTRAWTWLVSDLTPGHTFDLQLIPDIATDVFLHGSMAALEDVTVPAGTFTACVRVDYVVDYGLSTCTDPFGTEVGTFHSATRGSVYYASGVGPVKSTEVFILLDQMTGTCAPPSEVGQPTSRVTMQLASTPVPTAAMTWGRAKALYR